MSSQQEIYQAVTDRMVAALEAGTVPWHQPWAAIGGGLPASMSSGKAYRGVNVFILGLTAQANGYTSPWWGTYRRIKEDLGGQVRRGESSTLIVFWKRISVDNRDGLVDDRGRPVKVSVPMLRYFRVFNAAQADGLPARFYPSAGMAKPEIESAELVIKSYLAREGSPTFSEDGGDSAAYNTVTDHVRVPASAAYESAAERYSTIFHELGHSTGHASRLNRPGVTRPTVFGCEAYSQEELCAEMCSAMLCAVTGTDVDGAAFDNSAAYIAGWLKSLKGDVKFAVMAGAQGQKAADHVIGRTYDDNDNGEE